MRMTKKICSLLLAFALVLSLLPTVAFAAEAECVYISISDDQQFVTAPDGTPMGFFPVPLEDVALIDLNDFGLGDYTYDADHDGTPELTALQLYIYVHEVILGLDWTDVYITGSAGSTYFAGGLFGFSDENLRYDYNGAYPAVDGWGLTADRIVLKDGDFLNIAHYTSWAFWGDSVTGFHYFTDAAGDLQHTYQVSANQPLELGLVRSYSDWNNGGAPAFDSEIGYAVYYGKTYGNAEGCVYSDENGLFSVTFPTAGTWYVWADGGFGAENPMDIVSAPALATVNVPDLQFTLDLTALEEPIYSGGVVAYDLADLSDFAFLDDTAEAGKKFECGFRADKHDLYTVYVDFYTDSAVVGFCVNGDNYFAEDPGTGYIDWELGNDTYVGYAFGYTDDDDREYAEFYLQLGSEDAYHTAGIWDITPLLLTDAIIETVSAIDDIYAAGDITTESSDAIDHAAALYEALSAAEKAVADHIFPDMLQLLEEAQTSYDQLMGQAAADKAAADAVKEKIAAIGTVTVFSGTKIKAARAAFDALSDAQKALVDNSNVLTAAENAVAALYQQAAKADHKAIFEATAQYLAGLGTPYVGSTGGEWMVIALTRAGLPCPEGYYDNVVQFVRDNINDKEQLHRSKSTENSRVILALTAAGHDVTDVDGHNLLMGLTDMKYVPKQGVNGAIWALIAFDSHGYEIPANSDAQEQVTREKLIAYILDKQLADGGWNLSGQAADPDMTGMALQALAPYYQTNDAVKAAVDKALACLSDKQMDNGGFGSIDGICTESCAQVIVALTALGIDPETDPRFVKNGVSVVDAMCLFALEGGGFAHMPNDTINGMATEQGEYALASYFRFKNGETSLYDMSDVRLPDNTPPAPVPAPETGDSAALTLFTAMLLTSAAALAVVLQRKKKYAQ